MKPTNHVLMVRPAIFCANSQTVSTNFFQQALPLKQDEVLSRAQHEFDQLVAVLQKHGVCVSVYQDSPMPETPDALFPNNWFVTLPKQHAVLFPMMAPNRRAERTKAVMAHLEQEGHHTETITDYAAFEQQGVFLEGTGSMVLDIPNKIAYCAISPRSNKRLFEQFCAEFGFTPVAFHAYQSVGNKRMLIYHTNVLMALGPEFVVVCLDAIDNTAERLFVEDTLHASGKTIIDITEAQVHQFVGNMLALTADDGSPLMAMSSQAYNALTSPQLKQLSHYAQPVHSPIPTIETLGGGGVRCMMAELY